MVLCSTLPWAQKQMQAGGPAVQEKLLFQFMDRQRASSAMVVYFQVTSAAVRANVIF